MCVCVCVCVCITYTYVFICISSVAQSCPALLQPHGLQHSRLPCPSPTPRACSNSCPYSQWCHPTISSYTHTHIYTHIFTYIYMYTYGLPRWLSGKESACQGRRHGLNPWVRKIPWRRKWQPIPVFLPGKSHGQRSLACYSPWDHKRVSHDLAIQQYHTRIYICLCVSQIAF